MLKSSQTQKNKMKKRRDRRPGVQNRMDPGQPIWLYDGEGAGHVAGRYRLGFKFDCSLTSCRELRTSNMRGTLLGTAGEGVGREIK